MFPHIPDEIYRQVTTMWEVPLLSRKAKAKLLLLRLLEAYFDGSLEELGTKNVISQIAEYEPTGRKLAQRLGTSLRKYQEQYDPILSITIQPGSFTPLINGYSGILSDLAKRETITTPMPDVDALADSANVDDSESSAAWDCKPSPSEAGKTADKVTRIAERLSHIETQISELNITRKSEDLNACAPPEPPPHCIDRSRVLDELHQKVFAARGGTIALIAVEGMAGIGKTAIAQIFCHDDEVKKTFPDGRFWFNVGQSHQSVFKPASGVDTLTRLLRGTDKAESYRELIRDKAILIVLDDVWDAGAVNAFRTYSPLSAIIFTTQKTELAVDMGSDSVRVPLLIESEARDLFCSWAGLRIDELSHTALDLLNECEGHTLAVSMLGAALNGKSQNVWEIALLRLRRSDTSDVARNFPYYTHKSLPKAFEVSVNSMRSDKLESGDLYVERYFYLAVLLEDMPASLPILQTLWRASEEDAIRTADEFVCRSLARRIDDNAIALHDLQLDFVRYKLKGELGREFGDSDALALIHDALYKSLHVLLPAPFQFASQICGRLLAHSDSPAIASFLSRISAGAPGPWLRPLRPSLDQAGSEVKMILEGHRYPVECADVTPDGRRLVSASIEGAVRLWDLVTGRAIGTLDGHNNSVDRIAVTKNGKQVLTASSDRTIRAWDLASGKQLYVWETDSERSCNVAATPDSRYAISGDDNGIIRMWDLRSGLLFREWDGGSSTICDLRLTLDGHYAVTGSRDGTLRVWDLNYGTLLSKLEGHDSEIWRLALTPDGNFAVTTSDDGSIRLWDLAKAEGPILLGSHSAAAFDIALTPNGYRAITVSKDETVRVWDLTRRASLHTLKGHIGAVLTVAVTPDGTEAISGGWDGTIRIWDLEKGKSARALSGHEQRVNQVVVTDDGSRIVSTSKDRTVRVWHCGKLRRVHTPIDHQSSVEHIVVTPNGEYAVSASTDETLKVWDLTKRSVLHTLVGHQDAVWCVALTQDGAYALSASGDKTVRVWDIASGRCVHTWALHSDKVWNVIVSPDGYWAASASEDGTVCVWDLQSGSHKYTLHGHDAPVSCIAATPDAKRLVSASRDGVIRVWQMENGEPVHALNAHSDYVSNLTVTPCGRHFVSASWDSTAAVWDLEKGNRLLTVDHWRSIYHLRLTENGSQAVTVSNEGMVRIWDVRNGNVLREYQAQRFAAAFELGQNGDRAISAGDDDSVRLWNLVNGKELACFRCDSEVRSMAVSKSNQIVVGDHRGRLHVLSICE